MKPYKRPFVVFAILAIVVAIALAAIAIVYPFLFIGNGFATFKSFIRHIYVNADVLKSLINFAPLELPKLLTLVIMAVLAVGSLVLLFVAIFGIKKKILAKLVGVLIGIAGLCVAYVGGLVAVNNIYYVTSIYSASQSINGAVAAWEGWNGAIDIIKGGQLGTQLIRFIVQIAMVLVTLLFAIFAPVAIVNGVKYARAALVNDEEVVAEELPEPVEEPAVVEEPLEAVPEEMPVFMPEPEDETVDPNNLSTTALAAIIKDVVREIVRDELERNNLLGRDGNGPVDSHTDNRSVVGATFGGPLIVQYFNGGIQSAVPTPAPAPAEEPKQEPKPEPAPAPVEEEPAPVEEEPAPVEEEPASAPVEEPAPVVEEPAPVVQNQPKTPIVRIPFEERLLDSDKELQEIYSELKNEILSYGVKSRVSSAGDTFRLHRKTYIKLTVAGKSLKLYFALNPDDYRDSPIPVQDASEKGIYAEIPLVFKVKSPLSVRRCKQLIQDVMERDGLEQGEVGTVNWIKELKAEMKSRKSDKK